MISLHNMFYTCTKNRQYIFFNAYCDYRLIFTKKLFYILHISFRFAYFSTVFTFVVMLDYYCAFAFVLTRYDKNITQLWGCKWCRMIINELLWLSKNNNGDGCRYRNYTFTYKHNFRVCLLKIIGVLDD